MTNDHSPLLIRGIYIERTSDGHHFAFGADLADEFPVDRDDIIGEFRVDGRNDDDRDYMLFATIIAKTSYRRAYRVNDNALVTCERCGDLKSELEDNCLCHARPVIVGGCVYGWDPVSPL